VISIFRLIKYTVYAEHFTLDTFNSLVADLRSNSGILLSNPTFPSKESLLKLGFLYAIDENVTDFVKFVRPEM